MRAKIIGIAISLFWVCMMCSLVVQRILPQRWLQKSMLVEPEVLASQWSDINEWTWVEREGGERIGAVVLSVTQKNPGAKGAKAYEVIQNGEVQIPLLFFSQPMRFSLTMDLSPEFNVSQFAAAVHLPPFAVEFAGFVLENRLFYRVDPRGANPIYSEMVLKQPLSLLSAIRPMISRQLDLVVGKEYPVDIMDPITGSNGRAVIRVAAEETIIYRGRPTEAIRLDTAFGGMTKSAWITPDGLTLRRQLLKGYYLETAERPEILRRYPHLRQSLAIPRFHVPEFIENAKRTNSTNPGLPPEALNLIGQLVGGE